METQADTQPIRSHIAADERVRTCRPAIVRPRRSPGSDEPRSETASGAEWNIVRGED
ncbi:hypothetical protein [Streptomyces sp. WAC07149]|uniref:hypothetical protein n=1 Tax=Streptomyces sp. WAC07149 TaxID=2487425 RepID=UPI00163CE28A|nr:hypothetical protein [Streptomyces sp. WAC07149]